MSKKFRVLAVILSTILAIMMPIQNLHNNYTVLRIEAHSGRTDSNGGHRDNKNKSGLGSYHYHCGGYPAHLHDNGVCPYSTKSSTSNSKSKSSDTTAPKKTTAKTSKESSATVKKVQKALNDLGYDCGKADGVLGSKTTKALKAFQKDNDLTVDGKIGQEVKKALKVK